MNIITIDCGASFIKGTLFSDNNQIKRIEQKSPSVSKDILVPDQIQELVGAVINVADQLSEGLTECGLAISNEMHGFLLSDESGAPVTDYISWQKEFGREMIDGHTAIDLFRNLIPEESITHTGMPLRTGFPSINLLYLIKASKIERYKNTPLLFFTLGDFLLFKLSGIIPECHPTNAAGTGLYNVVSGQWDTEITKAVFSDYPIILLKTGNNGFTFKRGQTNYLAFPALGDQQAALLGAGFEKPTDISFNIGTGGQVSRICNKADFSPDYQIRPYFHDCYIKTIPFIPSGRAFNVYVRFVKDICSKLHLEADDSAIWKLIKDSALAENPTELDLDLGFFDNAFSKGFTGHIDHLGEYDLTAENLFYSLHKQAAKNYLTAARLISKGSSDPVEKVVFSGGVARRLDALREMILQNYPDGIETTVSNNETALGLKRYFGDRAHE